MTQIKRFTMRFHAILLQLYPTPYRAEFGDEIATTFAEMVAATDTLAAPLWLLWREARDWPSTVLTEYWLWVQASFAYHRNRQRRIQPARPGLLPPEKTGLMPPAATSFIARNPVVQRLFDLLFASFWLLLLSPLLPIVYVLIRLDSAGPAFYQQRRIDLDGESYIMYKFRSMTAAPGDNTRTITRVGKILRKYSVDELPQLFNILKGEMSVLGPRPGAPR